MDVNYIRDTLTVLNDDHQLDIQIQPFNMSVENVSYEVLTLDGSESLENTRVVSLKEENNYFSKRAPLFFRIFWIAVMSAEPKFKGSTLLFAA